MSSITFCERPRILLAQVLAYFDSTSIPLHLGTSPGPRALTAAASHSDADISPLGLAVSERVFLLWSPPHCQELLSQ